MEESPSTSVASEPTVGKLKRSMIPLSLQNKRQALLAKTKKQHCGSLSKQDQEETPASSPRRMTTCIFNRPVTLKTSHPDSKVMFHKERELLFKKPQQVSAYKRLEGFRACSSNGDVLGTLDLSDIYKSTAPGSADGSLGHGGTGHQSTRSSHLAELISAEGLQLPPALCKEITEVAIQRQTLKVKEARERLVMALRADDLAREAERARSEEGSGDLHMRSEDSGLCGGTADKALDHQT